MSNTLQASLFVRFGKNLLKRQIIEVSFSDDSELIKRSIDNINKISITAPQLEVSLVKIESITEEQGIETSEQGREVKESTATFSAIDLIDEIERETGLARQTAFKIVKGIENRREITKNPPCFLREAIRRVRDIEFRGND